MKNKAIVNQTPNGREGGNQAVSLKELARHLNLSTTTLSLVLNDAPAAVSIPQDTKDRVHRAAREFNYRPNFLARSLRAQRTFTIGVLVPELSDGYSAMVLGGIEDYLLQENYFYLVASHRHDDELLEQYRRLLCERRVEGLIAVDTPCGGKDSPLPVVTVSGHALGVTNVALDHDRAASLALEHLKTLGHTRIAFIKGQDFSSDTEVRFSAIRHAMQNFNLRIDEKLVAQLEGNSPSPELGYVATRKLLAANRSFTALFAFNDVSATGAIRALQEAGKHVPGDVSVVGFDDVYSAAFQNPPLTTVRQPLREMGKLAAETLLKRLTAGRDTESPQLLTVQPELIVRESTAACSSRKSEVENRK
ncbi:MAG: LacI family transcriptional regulator [Pyrinomonadaceae bacterium MAG19_C2-C3]|nr:LacI family transcriptional regulator [Pyrinomonadaceae bacterium MAG19_C2-C3]